MSNAADDDFVLFEEPAPAPRAQRWRAAALAGWASAAEIAGTLKARIAVSVAALIALAVVLAAGDLRDSAQMQAQAIRLAEQQQHAQEAAAAVARRLESRQQWLQLAAARLTPASLEQESAALSFLDQQAVLASAFSGVFIAGRDGRLAAFADEHGTRNPGMSIADREYFVQLVRERRSVVSAPLIGKLFSVPIVVLAAPVLGEGGSVVGAVGGNLHLADRPLIETTAASGAPGATAIVVDGQGRILSHPDRQRIFRDLGAEPQVGPALRAWFDATVAPQRGSVAARVGPLLAGAAPVPGTPWWVLHHGDPAAALNPDAVPRGQVLLLALGSALAGGLAMWGLLAVLLRPLARLERRALGLLDGSLPVDQGWPRGAGEIGRLARVLQHVMRERAQSEQQNHGLMKRLAGVMDAAPIGIAFVRGTHFELISREFSVLLGYPDDMLLGRAVRDVFASELEFDRSLADAAAGGSDGIFDGEFMLLRRDGSTFHGHVQARRVDPVDPGAGSIWLVADVTERRAERERLAWSAHHDALTRLHNRAAFEAELQRLLEARPRALPLSLLFIDLDHFKQINDTAGHAAGDDVLRDVATCLTSGVRGTDFVARLGGDEFAVILRSCAQDAALRLADGLRAAAQQIGVVHDGRRLNIGASIGVVEIDRADGDLAHWLGQADAACYEAKRSGRDAVRTASPGGPLRLVSGPTTG
jgi:diguanylate cyclase